MRNRRFQNLIMLPDDFTPSSHDIICGKGKDCYDHKGNRWFRHIVSFYVDGYIAAKDSKFKKSKIVSDIFNKIRRYLGRNNGFVSRDRKNGNWCQVCAAKAREKIGHELRVAVSNRGKKAEKAKMLAHEAQKFRRLHVIQQAIFAELKVKSDMEMALEEKGSLDEEQDEIQCIMEEDDAFLNIDDMEILYMLGIE
mmetsp:Transcript_16027/g.20283  ORF Transcript_16027/g.20283 Transcript_16027/m.20283 type:complete len:195 (+) Transcript_16027:41-625(+)